MTFERAYCKEINSIISPYEARDLYFDDKSKYYKRKLSFYCDIGDCRAELTPVCIYSVKRMKMPLHFRTKKDEIHKCTINKTKHNNCTFSDSKIGKHNRFKPSLVPTVFLLEKKEHSISSSDINSSIERNIVTTNKNIKLHQSQQFFGNVDTDSFENIIDCFERYKSELKRHLLTIGNLTKYYPNFFKNIKFFQDSQGLIYWGKIRTPKKYGKNYSLQFYNEVKYNEIYLPVKIYITNELISKYSKKEMLIDQLDEIIEEKYNVLCYFVGIYPQFHSYTYKGQTKYSWKVDILNLDHIHFTFENKS